MDIDDLRQKFVAYYIKALLNQARTLKFIEIPQVPYLHGEMLLMEATERNEFRARAFVETKTALDLMGIPYLVQGFAIRINDEIPTTVEPPNQFGVLPFV